HSSAQSAAPERVVHSLVRTAGEPLALGIGGGVSAERLRVPAAGKREGFPSIRIPDKPISILVGMDPTQPSGDGAALVVLRVAGALPIAVGRVLGECECHREFGR